ncbi:hypothetical protein BV22DRAFT_1002412 [Leucogyrophana mollusca]|uniref:Uncharacterized protein n=1 Tax=Leucogyrophana mollusca TaxID=85980 RepID=A0ACB8BVV7_9AGAM|nr:hypothetical protein BV22DRAFT_1002412 [Leucogyrophana mollusca]
MTSTTQQRELPPLDGSLQFAELIDFNLHKNPAHAMFVFADDKQPTALTEITFLEFGRAAHRAAYAVRPTRTGPEGEVVVLVANCDTLLHHAVVGGMSIAGLVVSIPLMVSACN